MSRLTWHNAYIKDCLEYFRSDSQKGLFGEEIGLRQQKYGKNKLPEEKPLSKIWLFLRQFKSPLMYILVIAGFITIFLGEYSESIVIFLIVVINAFIGYFQENKTSEILASIKKLVTIKALVIRDNEEKEILQESLVPGDVFLLRPGDKVPADGRILDSEGLQLDESALTGEWLPVQKSNQRLLKEVPLADRNNMVYMGTIVQGGKAKVLVVATGLDTEIGKIASITKGILEEKTPYQKKIEHFGKFITIIILLASVAIFLGGLMTGKDVVDIFLTAVAIAVAAIPEGLPIAVTLVFAFGVRELLAKKGLVRQLVAAETLGSTSVICTDKTGTLTEAKMEVRGVYDAEGKLLGDNAKTSLNISDSNLLPLKIALLRSDAFIENLHDPMAQWIVRGESTERAMVLAAVQSGLDKKKILDKERQLHELIFDSKNKYSASLHHLNTQEDIVYAMGAPENIIDLCKYVDIKNNPKAATVKQIKQLKDKYSLLAAEGFRVISVSYRVIPKKGIDNFQFNDLVKKESKKVYEKMLQDMVFAGFIVLHDPIRKEAKMAIKMCQKAGMKPIIITGDHRLTAKAIARELALEVKDDNILEGKDLDRMSDEEFYKVFRNIKVYARTEPKHKMRIITAWQGQGEVVAMTGDGINDSPALKKADIGVALGSGTEVAKESSDLILLDDNFEVILVAVEEGRKILDNIRKVVTYLLSGGFTEVILIGAALLLHLPLPILPSQILWKNIIEDTPPSFALTLEPMEKDIMDRNPEPLHAPLLTREMKFLIFAIGIITDIMLFGIFMWLLNMHYPISKIRTIMFAGLIIDSFFLIFSFRNLRKNIWHYNIFSNSYVFITIIIGIALLLFAIYSSIGHLLLHTVQIGLFEWSILVGFGLINLLMIETAKFCFNHINKLKNIKV